MALEDSLNSKLEVRFVIILTKMLTEPAEMIRFLGIKCPAGVSTQAAVASQKILLEYLLEEQRRYFTTGIVDLRLRKHFRGLRLDETVKISEVISELRASRAKFVFDNDLHDKNLFEFFWTASLSRPMKRLRWVVGKVEVDATSDLRFCDTPRSFKVSDFLWGNNYALERGFNALLVAKI